MPCYEPVIGVVAGRPYTAVPCGRCVGCRLERSRQWAVRCMHEAQMVDASSFITLTYRPEAVPEGGTLKHRDFQLFMKRLRRARVGRVSYFMCGEYGEQFLRPHYHACLFGVDFGDKVFWRRGGDGDQIFLSEELTELWGLGHTSVGSVTFRSAGYVARYAMKKLSGEAEKRRCERFSSETGEIFSVAPEYTTMSLKPGLGAKWYEQFARDVYPSDELVVRGRVCKPPRYYDVLLERERPEEMDRVRRGRVLAARARWYDSTRKRLESRGAVAEASLKFLKREI